MQILAKLYDCIDEHLARPDPDWEGFARAFKSIHASDFVLYRAVFTTSDAVMDRLEVVSTSNPPLMEDYIRRRIYEHHAIPETVLTPLEPVRRSDWIPDDAFRKLGPLGDYLIANGMFHIINVPAIMTDGTFVCIHAWRNEHENNFSDLEKQRLALLMRHLLAIVSQSRLLAGDTKPEVLEFGRKYGLTPTESEILGALIEGHSLRSIAAVSNRGYGTVRWHVQNILGKCEVKTQQSLLTEFYQLMKR